jgi:6-phosphogluconolactonase
VAVDPTGKFLYVADSSGSYGSIITLNINASSGVLTGVPVLLPFMDVSAAALVVSPTGKFVYATGGTDGVLAYTANASSGALAAVSGSPFRAGIRSSGVAMDPTGKFVYVPNLFQCIGCDAGSVSAFSVNASSGALIPIPGSPFPDAGLGPFGAAADPTGKFLYVSNVSSGCVSAYTITASSGALTAVPGSPFFAGTSLRHWRSTPPASSST